MVPKEVQSRSGGLVEVFALESFTPCFLCFLPEVISTVSSRRQPFPPICTVGTEVRNTRKSSTIFTVGIMVKSVAFPRDFDVQSRLEIMNVVNGSQQLHEAV
jgi:hypothetical protein